MNEVLDSFLIEEINEALYCELWRFLSSENVIQGTFEGSYHTLIKLSGGQVVIYRHSIGLQNSKYRDAVIVAKNYLLKKINSRAYELRLPDIQNIFD